MARYLSFVSNRDDAASFDHTRFVDGVDAKTSEEIELQKGRVGGERRLRESSARIAKERIQGRFVGFGQSTHNLMLMADRKLSN